MEAAFAQARKDFIGSQWISKVTPDFTVTTEALTGSDGNQIVTYRTPDDIAAVTVHINHFLANFMPKPIAIVPVAPSFNDDIDKIESLPIRYFYVTYDYCTRRKGSLNKGSTFIRVSAGELFSIGILQNFITKNLKRDLGIEATTVMIANWQPVLQQDYDDFVSEVDA